MKRKGQLQFSGKSGESSKKKSTLKKFKSVSEASMALSHRSYTGTSPVSHKRY